MLKIAESYILIQKIENDTFMTWILYYARLREMFQSSVQIYVLIRERWKCGNIFLKFTVLLTNRSFMYVLYLPRS